MNKNHPYSVVKRGLQYYPTIFPHVFTVLEHIFCTNGNGYDLDKDGNLVSDPYGEKDKYITDLGIDRLAYDFLHCKNYYIYPINDYDYEFESFQGKHFYTDLYHYPNMNKEWQDAARWFINEIVKRDLSAWKKIYNAQGVLKGDTKTQTEDKYLYMVNARKHIKKFIKKFNIVLNFDDKYNWESGFLAFVKVK
jgi:hypothetical protein